MYDACGTGLFPSVGLGPAEYGEGAASDRAAIFDRGSGQGADGRGEAHPAPALIGPCDGEAARACLLEIGEEVLPEIPAAKAVGYTLNPGEALSRFLEGGDLEIGNGATEGANRDIAIGHGNWAGRSRQVAENRMEAATKRMGGTEEL